ncbi:uncharacterized protein [Haliotis cracherodii]|uniref:uncharacterized protein isoform X1 n=1 Tax=Haliotis cracherodii TaxID=6455 RepID=UPI0039EBF21D
MKLHRIVIVSGALLGLVYVVGYLKRLRRNTNVQECEHRDTEHTAVMQRRKLKDKQLVSSTNYETEVNQLVDIFREKVATLKKKHIWSELRPFPRCTGKEKKALDMCNDTAACKHPLPAADCQENIRNILTPVTKLKEGALGRIKDVFNIQERRKYAFVTAASADHFDESQEMIMTLDKYIFPHLSNYSFYYYDMGLYRSQVKLLEKYGRAVIKRYPFDLLPDRFSYLKCYTWKPIVMQAHFDNAEYTVWLDASSRFDKGNPREMFNLLKETGVLMSPWPYPFAQHCSKHMFSYFNTEPCHFSVYHESESGFIMLRNQPFTRRLIMDPWVACAVDPNCMCHPGAKQLLSCSFRTRKYGKCHRYDQSAINLILLQMFRRNIDSVQIPKKKYAHVSRKKGLLYLKDLHRTTPSKK